MRIWSAAALTAQVLSSSAGCGDSTPPVSQYLSFNYTVTPPGSGTSQPLMLPIVPAMTVCDANNKKIVLYAMQGNASATLTLQGLGTSPYQTSLTASYQTVGTAQLDLQVPLTFDAMGVGHTPVMFTTSDLSEGVTCSFDLPVGDYFTMLSGSFTCTSSQTAMPRRIDLSQGMIVATPCGAPM